MNNLESARPVWIGYVVSVILVIIVTAGLSALNRVFPLAEFPVPYVLLTMVVAYFFGGGPAIVAGVLGWIAFTALFVPEIGRIWPIAVTPEGWAREVAFVLGVIVVAIAAIQAKKSNRRIQRLADEAAAVNVSLAEEVVERSRIAEALWESQERFHLMVEAVKDYAIFMLDPEGRVTVWNKGAERITGYTAEEMTGEFFYRLYPEEDIASGKPQQELAVATEQGRFSDENWRVRKDGSLFWASVLTTAMRNERGELRGFAKITQDVTERKRAEEALRESEAQLRAIVDNLTEGLVVSDLEGNLVHWNRAALDMHGFASMEEGLRRLPEFTEIFELAAVDGTVLKVDEWPVPRILRGEHLRDWEVHIRRISSDWRRIFSYGGVLVRVAEDQPVLAVVTITDITERRRSEEDIRRLNEELEGRVAQRTAELEAANKELEAFSYSVSHDLRAPLRAIDGFSNALLKGYRESLDEKGQDYLQRVRNASQRMAQLIDDILGLSRAGRVEMHRQRVDVSALARDIVDELHRGQPERQYQLDVAEGMYVHADPHLLGIALTNLLSNAWKFTGGRHLAHIEMGSIKENGVRVYYIRDNGVGFDPTYADKLFSPFQRLHTETEFPGTGIGLALVQRILRRHGGRIWAESRLGEGATFYFTVGDNDQ